MRDPEPRRRPFWHLRRRPESVESEIDEELDGHLQMRAEELQARGLPAHEARLEALRRFGDLESTRRYCRRQDRGKESRMRRTLMIGDLAGDLRVCLRSLLRAPVLTLTIVLTVGLGIGATTAIFSAVHAAFIRPLPYEDPDLLVRIYTDAPPNKFRFSVADYLALQEQQTHFARIAGHTPRSMAFSDGSEAERLRGREVTWDYFGLLGIRPALGRDFTESDGRPGGPPVVIVSHGFWLRRLGGRPDALGRPVRLDGSDYELVAVLPPLAGPLEQGPDFFVAARWETPPRKGPFMISVLGRLREASERSAAASELGAICRRIFPIWKASYQDESASWGMMDLKTHVLGDVRAVAGLALGAVGLVWLIACTNASNLLIARVTSRRRELAVRSALGASRARVVRHLLAESALLASGAAVLGLGLAWAGIGLLRGFGAEYFPRTQEIALDAPVLWFLASVTAASGLLFGLVPAVHGTGGPLDDALRSSGRSSTGSVAVRRLRRALVGSQFAIATPLLVVAGLLLASLNELGRVELGFDGRNMISGSLLLPESQYREPGSVAGFWDELTRRVEALPGVAGVAFADGRPPDDVGNFNNFDLEDAPTPADQSQPVTPWVSVTPEYFPLLGLALQEGRLFDERDGRTENIDVVVVDRAWAKRFFPGGSAVGKRLREGGCTTCPWTTVVGVVGDVKYAGLDKPDQGTVYWPMAGRGAHPIAETSSRFRYLVVRTSLDPAAVLPGIRQAVRALDGRLPLSSVATVEEMVARSLDQPRSLSLLVGALAAVALLLSVVGIYGVMAHYVEQHAKDIGIRLALGGSPGDVFRLIVGQGMKVVAGGVLAGLLTALALARLMSGLLFGVGAADPATYLVVATTLLGIALLACSLPARRATGVEPGVVLHTE
ncbi:MAG TPA: ABC transporter permease [Candidatus Cryosericum sp.]|nr:ABC transporter permease [Candidatus Cryosericum sp.]